MINDLFRTYKKIILLLLVLLCSVVFWFYGCRHQQRSQSEVVEWNKKTIKGTNGYCYKFKTSNCTGTVTFGAAGYVAKDKEMPVTLDIFAAEKDFTGVMKVTLPGENGKGIAYQSAVKCKAGEKEKIVLNVPQLGDPSAICFEIMDSFGVTELSEDVSFSDAKNRNGAFSEQAENLIGVLSGQSKELSYLNSLKIGEESDEESVKVVCYSKNSFPQTEEEFYTRLQGQVEALKGAKHVMGFCYTQLTDVEQEKNGIYYYDRTPKFDMKRIKSIFELIPSSHTNLK